MCNASPQTASADAPGSSGAKGWSFGGVLSWAAMARPPYPRTDQALMEATLGRRMTLGETRSLRRLTVKGYLLTPLPSPGAPSPSLLKRALVSIPWHPPQGLRERKRRRADGKLEGTVK